MNYEMHNEHEEGEDDFGEDEYDPEDRETYPQGLYDDDGPAVIQCPHCGKDILEESEQCPKCGMYLSKEDVSRDPRRGPIIVMALLAILAVLASIFTG